MVKDFNDTPDMAEPGVSDLQEKVLMMLEASGLPTETNDAVMKLIEGGERGLVPCDGCGLLVDQNADACSHCG